MHLSVCMWCHLLHELKGPKGMWSLSKIGILLPSLCCACCDQHAHHKGSKLLLILTLAFSALVSVVENQNGVMLKYREYLTEASYCFLRNWSPGSWVKWQIQLQNSIFCACSGETGECLWLWDYVQLCLKPQSSNSQIAMRHWHPNLYFLINRKNSTVTVTSKSLINNTYNVLYINNP